MSTGFEQEVGDARLESPTRRFIRAAPLSGATNKSKGLESPDRTAAAESSPVSNAGQPLTPEEVRELDRSFNEMPTEKVLAWAWTRYGTRAAIGTSFQGAGLVMMHL